MSRPNLLFFMTDQQRADSIGAFGNAIARDLRMEPALVAQFLPAS